MKYLIVFLFIVGCSRSNVEDVKTHAEITWSQAGFKIVGYEGYEMGGGGFGTSYGGAQVWYMVTRNNGVTYEGSIQRWGDEYHIYNLKAVDAIKGTSP